jgi:hypothetical protein
MGFTLTYLAVAAALKSNARRVALLLGAGDRLLQRCGAVHQGRYQELVERGRMVARAQLGSATFGSLQQQGRALEFEKAVALVTDLGPLASR